MSGNSNGMQKCPSKEELIKKINEHSFAVDDLVLYLDTHPAPMSRKAIMTREPASR